MRRVVTSFRARIFLITALIVVLVIAGIAALSWRSIFSYQLEGLDQRLCSEARRLASELPLDEMLADLEQDIAPKLQLQSTQQLLLWRQSAPPAADYGVASVLSSSRWPAQLTPAQMLWAQGAAVSSPLQLLPALFGTDGNRAAPGVTNTDACRWSTFTLGGADWRAARVVSRYSDGLVAADLAAVRHVLNEGLQRLASVALPLALVWTGLGAWALSALAIGPLTRLRRNMERVNEKALDQRLPLDREDREFGALIDAYNTMLERLELSFHQACRFSADAAHELKTPLTILQGQLEQAINVSSHWPIQVALTQMLDEVSRLSAITRKLLLLSQADAGQLPLLLSRVDLSPMLSERLADAQLLGLQNITISSELPAHAFVQADEQLLGQVLNNLCSNAFRYTPAGGWIKVRARVLPTGVTIFMANSATPIPEATRLRFFDRFFRGNAAHNRTTDGYGLGLSLSRVIARAHGGDLTLQRSAENEVRLRLWLPGK